MIRDLNIFFIEDNKYFFLCLNNNPDFNFLFYYKYNYQKKKNSNYYSNIFLTPSGD